MKKAILGLASVAAIFASCTKTEVVETNGSNPNVIGFEASTGKSRANTNDLNGIKGDAAGFGVYATNGAAPAQFIDNKAYKFESNVWKWDAADIMWPTTAADYPINFYAYYPKSSATLAATLTKEYTVAATAADQIDYLAANKLNVVTRPGSSNVALNFGHILSKIDFSVATGAAVTVEVQSIAIKNVGNKGTFNFANLAWSVAPSAFASSYSYMTAPAIPANSFAGATTAAAVTGASNSLMLMPQDLSSRKWDVTGLTTLATQSYIEVVYRVVETASGRDVVGFTNAANHPDYGTSALTGSLFVKVAFPLPTVWEKSKAYNYVIYLGDPAYSGGNVIADKFIDKDGNLTNFTVVNPDNGTTITVPGPIVNTNTPIGFDVTVSNWDDANGTIDVQ